MISLGVLTLLTHPQERATLLAEPDRMSAAADEMLRFFSINDGTPLRRAMEDVLIGDMLAVCRSREARKRASIAN
jgi:pentalenic acid synthase